MNYNLDDTESSDFEKENVFQVRPQSNDRRRGFESKASSENPREKMYQHRAETFSKNPEPLAPNTRQNKPLAESSPFKNKSLTQLEIYQIRGEEQSQIKNTTHKKDEINQMFWEKSLNMVRTKDKPLLNDYIQVESLHHTLQNEQDLSKEPKLRRQSSSKKVFNSNSKSGSFLGDNLIEDTFLSKPEASKPK